MRKPTEVSSVALDDGTPESSRLRNVGTKLENLYGRRGAHRSESAVVFQRDHSAEHRADFRNQLEPAGGDTALDIVVDVLPARATGGGSEIKTNISGELSIFMEVEGETSLGLAGLIAGSPNKPAEDQAVNWIQRIPIEQTEQPLRLEERRLLEQRLAVGLRHGFELKQARPGTRISARRRISRPGSTISTRQKSNGSPTRRSFESRRPRLRAKFGGDGFQSFDIASGKN